jgi:hypothetical protein
VTAQECQQGQVWVIAWQTQYSTVFE